jgi:DedD protein
MEGKKVLWVVFSIALALVVILAGGLFLLRPRQPKGSETPAAAPSLQGYDPYEYVRGISGPPGLTPPPTESEPVVIVVGEKPADGEPALQPAAALPEPARAPAPAVPAAGPAAAAPAAAAAPTAAPAAKPVAKPAAKPAARPAPEPKPASVRVTEYWIQAGSFSSAARAEEVARKLEEKGLAARTTTRDLNGKTHFRVRVGPYSNKAEAEKFLGWIRELKGFESSYISMVAGRRAMP